LNRTQSEFLRVPGASLYYEMRGSGPLLLMIAGGDGGGGGFDALAGQLASHFTVVTYDRRGSFKSTLDEPVGDMRLETHSDDAHRLLDAVVGPAAAPAYVFGSSAGALIGLDLAIRYPEGVRVLVAHEPPVEGLLPEFDRFQDDMLATYQREGAMPAMMKFMASLSVNYADLEPGVELPQRDTRRPGSGEAFFAYTFQPVHRYRLDLAALAAAPTHIVLAAGSAAPASMGYRCTAALAERLGVSLVEFPSHHAGYVSHPKAFAERLRSVLADESAT
jgi:pimeloyl-ACP methyl ester carboxylesterase